MHYHVHTRSGLATFPDEASAKSLQDELNATGYGCHWYPCDKECDDE